MLPGEHNQSRDWETREEAETDWEHGERPENRELERRIQNGIILIDKPDGPTSHQVSIWVKKLLEQEKSGHSGTLDPSVTGVLPIGLNQGTKILQALTIAGKEYIGSMELDEEISPDTIREQASTYTGTVKQMPPKKSAVKREEREREIYKLEILEVEGQQVLFRIECEKGFYVRTFCRNFGEALGTAGEMEDLRRTRVGVLQEDQLHTLQDVKDQYEFWNEGKDNRLDEIILPIEAGVRHLKKIMVKDTAIASLCHGANLGTQGISRLQEGIEPGDTVALLSLKGELVALAEALMTTEELQEDDGTGCDLQRVFMDKDVYPKAWK